MNDFDWVMDYDKEKFDLIDVMLEFKNKFPTNLDNATVKRLCIIEGYIKKLRTIDVICYDTSVIHVKERMIKEFGEIIKLTEKHQNYGFDPRKIRKKIRSIKTIIPGLINLMVLVNIT